MNAHESCPTTDGSESGFCSKNEGDDKSGNSRWIFIGALLGLTLLSVSGIVFNEYRDSHGQRLQFPSFIKTRTLSLAGPVPNSPPPVVVPLSADMIRVSAIALGHPRLAVINGKTVTEGDRITLQASDPKAALTLTVFKIGDGSIQFTDGKQFFTAQLAISSPPPRKTR